MEHLEHAYLMGTRLGSSGFGTVYMGTRKHDVLSVAIKHIAKRKLVKWAQVDSHKLPLEIGLLSKVSNIPGVIKMLNYFEKSDKFVIIMEQPNAIKDIFDYITESGPLAEDLSRNFFCQIVTILQDVHRVGIFHRDIKDENILVNMENMELRLIDFVSGTFHKEDVYTDFEGECVGYLVSMNILLQQLFTLGEPEYKDIFIVGIMILTSFQNNLTWVVGFQLKWFLLKMINI